MKAMSQMSEKPIQVPRATAPARPSTPTATPRLEEKELAKALMARPPSSGVMGSRLKRLMTAHQAATAAQNGSRVRSAGAERQEGEEAAPERAVERHVGLLPARGEGVLGDRQRPEERDEVHAAHPHAGAAHGVDVAVLVDEELEEEQQAELPGEEDRVGGRRGGGHGDVGPLEGLQEPGADLAGRGDELAAQLEGHGPEPEPRARPGRRGPAAAASPAVPRQRRPAWAGRRLGGATAPAAAAAATSASQSGRSLPGRHPLHQHRQEERRLLEVDHLERTTRRPRCTGRQGPWPAKAPKAKAPALADRPARRSAGSRRPRARPGRSRAAAPPRRRRGGAPPRRRGAAPRWPPAAAPRRGGPRRRWPPPPRRGGPPPRGCDGEAEGQPPTAPRRMTWPRPRWTGLKMAGSVDIVLRSF